MHYRSLGRTGIKVSPYALGAMNFGAMSNTDHDDSIRIVHAALDAGINLIDTADVYSLGESEEIVGKAIKARRDNVVLATKFSNPMGGDDPNRRGGSRRWILAAVENSLRRLQTDYIDLYQYHYLDAASDLEETLAALTDLVQAGKVRAIGTSKFPAAEIVEAQWISERRGLQRFRSEQPTYSILNRAVERDVLPVAGRYGIGTIVYSPLAQGLLTGRVRKGRESELTRSGTYYAHLRDERRIDIVERLIPLADEFGMSLTHLAMAFAIAHPGVTSALLGPRTIEHLEDSLAGAEIELGDDILDRIDEIVPPGTDVGHLQMSYNPPALVDPRLRRRPIEERTAA
ncbi:aldo/keto reductase [Allobranchiibius sp. GilTou73]|uniref:aldo/keto reductase n=1 Tax=Allobranchiibius sp. GilTou73 TaxID=2904523 RepID=UPI001F356810|nr:aldo/keto reductase [Allobranchiibius sp. GilTou73]UIJ34389.1 aldo/keto reductase [Allobranchiibius sp. GilTou73]